MVFHPPRNGGLAGACSFQGDGRSIREEETLEISSGVD